MQKEKVFNLIILDESGSMSFIEEATIRGFNEVVQTVKGVAKQFPEQEHYISLVSFNSLGIKTIHDCEPVETLNEINSSLYDPNAGTPLFDAMGKAINDLRRVAATHPDCHVLVTILTDGEENSSKEFSGQQIKQLIDELKLNKWIFTYIGANHDVEEFALSISITNTMSFEANEVEMKRMFAKENKARMNYSSNIRNKMNTTHGFYKDVDDE